eukprot:g8630.t1
MGAVVLIGVAQAASGSSVSRLRASQLQRLPQQQQQQQRQAQNDITENGGLKTGGGSGSGNLEYERDRRVSHGVGDGVAVPARGQFGLGLPQVQSFKSTRDPQCNLPEEFPCTLNTTAIGMVESGFATFYDDTCEATGAEGCYTDGIAACRTCYLSTEVYMAATNSTEISRPSWVMCPCCVPTTLVDSHHDIEVTAYDYSVFNISESACTDAPTPAPAPAQTVPTTSPPTADDAPTATPAPMEAPTAAPQAGSRAMPTLAPLETTSSPETTPAPSAASTATPDDGTAAGETGTNDLDTSDGDDGLSMGAKVGIGAGAAVGVIILGAVGFGIMKANGRT